MQTYKTIKRLICLGAFNNKVAALLFYGPCASGNP